MCFLPTSTNQHNPPALLLRQVAKNMPEEQLHKLIKRVAVSLSSIGRVMQVYWGDRSSTPSTRNMMKHGGDLKFYMRSVDIDLLDLPFSGERL